MDLVVGATGTLGRQICENLKRKGRNVRALVRKGSNAARVESLRAIGVETTLGDTKDRASLEAAMRGATNVICTASSTLSRGDGDSIDTVDRAGNLSAIDAAKAAGVDQFVFVSFPDSETTFPLRAAKAEVEKGLQASGLAFTILQPVYFLETWFSQPLGFDVASRTARTYATGTGRISWVSFLDVAQVAAQSLSLDLARNRIFTFGGPEAISQRQVIEIFERLGGQPFAVQDIPREALLQQFETSVDPMEKSFAAMMLILGHGDRWQYDNADLLSVFDVELTSPHEFVQRSLG